jgi:hypothetical protein
MVAQPAEVALLPKLAHRWNSAISAGCATFSEDRNESTLGTNHSPDRQKGGEEMHALRQDWELRQET